MTVTTVPTFVATIYVGLKVRETGEILHRSVATTAIQKYVNAVGLCVTVTGTQFIYTNGSESGLAIGLINYPRFPSSPEQIKAHAIAIAETLLKACQQQKVSVVTPTETVMITVDSGPRRSGGEMIEVDFDYGNGQKSGLGISGG